MTSANARTVKAARISTTFYYVPLWLGMERGMFADRNITIELEQIGDGAVATNRLRSGDLDVSLAPPDGVIADAAAGGPLRVIAGNTSGLSHNLIALPQFKQVSDLRGAHIGCISMTEGSTFHFQEIAKQHGLDVSDYRLDPVGGAPTRHKLLLEGKIDAGLQSIPFTYMEEEAGLVDLAKASDYVPDYQFNSINANSKWAEENTDLAVDFLAAMIEATRLMHADKAAAAATAAREMNIELRFAERAWDDFMDLKIMPADLGVNEPGLEKVAELMAKAGVIKGELPKPSQYVDLRYRDMALKR